MSSQGGQGRRIPQKGWARSPEGACRGQRQLEARGEKSLPQGQQGQRACGNLGPGAARRTQPDRDRSGTTAGILALPLWPWGAPALTSPSGERGEG